MPRLKKTDRMDAAEPHFLGDRRRGWKLEDRLQFQLNFLGDVDIDPELEDQPGVFGRTAESLERDCGWWND